jgi:uncharacterized SAM-binding protein YcdF (DUF218 family)
MGSGGVRTEAEGAGRSLSRRLFRWAARVVGGVIVVGLLAAWLLPGWTLAPLARWLDVSTPPVEVDYVLVLNGDPETRPFAAAALVRAGLARQVLLTKQRLTLESAQVRQGVMASELEITRRILLARGVAEQAIRVLPGEIASTADEARVLAEFLKENPGSRVAVVTNGFHTARARWIFRRAAGGGGELHFVGVPRDGVDERGWWRTPGGWIVYGSEYAKFLYYRLCY